MTKSVVRRPSRPYVEGLEKRDQPGSVLTGGLDPSLLASSWLSHSLLSVFDELVAARVMTPTNTGVVNSVASGDTTQPPLSRSDLDVPASIPPNWAVPRLQDVFGLGATRPDLSLTLGSGTGMERPGDVGTRGPNLLFYGGDFDGRSALANEYNTLVSDARVYDNVR